MTKFNKTGTIDKTKSKQSLLTETMERRHSEHYGSVTYRKNSYMINTGISAVFNAGHIQTRK